MYQYLYLINVIDSINLTLNFFLMISSFIFVLLAFIAFIFKDEFEDETLENIKKFFSFKILLIYFSLIFISCITPNKLSMYSYVLEKTYYDSNNSELYQDLSDYIKKEMMKTIKNK